MTHAITPTIDFSIPAMRRWAKLPEHVRAEVIFGKLYMLNTPTLTHAKVVTEIFLELVNYVKANALGECFCVPLGVVLLNGTNVVVPDIMFISNENRHNLLDRGMFGPCDLHIEVLSPTNRKHDLILKKELYEQSGVREYWIIDPVTKDAWGYLLDNKKYDEPLTLNSKINIRVLAKESTF